MTYRIEIMPRALSDAQEAYDWYYQRSPDWADRWFRGLLAAISSLEEWPGRWPVTKEKHGYNYEVRQLLYGRRKQTYRILYTIGEDTVKILHIRHASRKSIRSRDEGEIDSDSQRNDALEN